MCLFSAEGLRGSLPGPQELDSWLVGTVRALQESMRDVQGRLQSLESMPAPREEVSPQGLGQDRGRALKVSVLGSSSSHFFVPTSLPARTFASSRDWHDSHCRQGP